MLGGGGLEGTGDTCVISASNLRSCSTQNYQLRLDKHHQDQARKNNGCQFPSFYLFNTYIFSNISKNIILYKFYILPENSGGNFCSC